MHRVRRSILAIFAGLAVGLAACSGGPGGTAGSDPATQSSVTTNEVEVVDNAFEPAHIETRVGEEVTWHWAGRIPHDVVGDAFDSGIQEVGTFTHRFDRPGTYTYECTLHSGMRGQVTVVDA